MAGPRTSISRPSISDTTFTSSSRKRRRAHASWINRTSYILAYPAPSYTDKTLLLKHLRPRLYLQLQRLAPDGRHYRPAIDVLSLAPPKDPTRLFASALKRCVGKIRSSHGNCLQFDRRDILLTKLSYDDDEHDDHYVSPTAGTATPETRASSGDPPHHHRGLERVLSRFEDLTERRVVAVLRAHNKIVTQDGRTWTASRRSSGSYEFTCGPDEHGEVLVARWVSPRAAGGTGSTGSSGGVRMSTSSTRSRATDVSGLGHHHHHHQPHMQGLSEAAFNFSLIDPRSRRHAVLATLSPSSLDIKDTYHQPSMSPRHSVGSDETLSSDPRVHVVDEDTRTLILASAVWLNLYLGWSPSY